MSSLNIFPTEILECITGVVPTSQQMRLWLCGDCILNYKLKNGGLKRTSLCWSGRTWMPWPRSYFTTHDGLVDVKWCVDIGTSLCPTLELNLLPKTLKRLHLVCEDVFILLRQQNINMRDMLPTLHYLRLSGKRLCEENIKNLPSDLIELHVTSFYAKIDSPNIFGDLPRHITRLTLNFAIVDQLEDENDLPSQLASLNVGSIKCNFNWFSKLPKSLEKLKIDAMAFDPNWLTLPPQLEELAVSFGPIPKSALPQLPQSLKTLEVQHIEDITAATAKLGPLLPKNLTRFFSKQPFGHLALQDLPASLTDFDVIVSPTHPDTLSFYSPESIKIRTADGGYSHQLNLFPFPTNLQTLELHHINDDVCAMLPRGLKRLSAGQGLITIKGASKLPKSLTYLSAHLRIFDDNGSMAYLRHISSLELSLDEMSAVGQLNEHWISSLQSSSSLETSPNTDYESECAYSSGINRHLTSFKVRVDVCTDYSAICHWFQKSFFDALPQFVNLESLMLDEIQDIPTDCLCYIPKNVTRLDISYMNCRSTFNVAKMSQIP